MDERKGLYGVLVGLCVGLAIGWLLWSGHGPSIRDWVDSHEDADAVLVVVVGTQENVEAIHRSVSPDRIIAFLDTGLAIAPQRLVVASLESTGEILMMAGWADRTLEIIDVKHRLREGNAVDEELALINSLMNNPTLTRGEAHFLLGSM